MFEHSTHLIFLEPNLQIYYQDMKKCHQAKKIVLLYGTFSRYFKNEKINKNKIAFCCPVEKFLPRFECFFPLHRYQFYLHHN